MKGKRGGAAPRQLSGRGLAYWSDGKEERISLCHARLSADLLNAKTESVFRRFGDKGEWTSSERRSRKSCPI